MELKESTLKEFKKKIKSIDNDFERTVGEVLLNLIGEITLFPVNIHYHKRIEIDDESFIPDYTIDIKSGDLHHIIFIELKQYTDISGILPQLDKFYSQICKFKNEDAYKEFVVHPLFVVESEDEFTRELINRARNYQITIHKADLFDELSDLISNISPQYGFLDFIKNKFNIMIEFEPKLIKRSCIQNQTFGLNILTFSMTARELLRLCYVYRASVIDPTELRYQRLINGDRLNEIKKFIINKNFESVFPNNLICNFSDECKPLIEETSSDNVKTITFENKYSALWIIDGQHRLFSFAKIKNLDNLLDEYSFIVTAYKSIKKKDQAKVFFCINNEQVGINSNLICYILSQLCDDKEGAAAKIALMLEDAGIFKSKIFKGIKRDRGTWLNLKTFVDYLTPSNDKKKSVKDNENLIGWEGYKRGWLQKDEKDIDTPYNVLKIYFECVKDKFQFDWGKGRQGFVQTNQGVSVFLKILLLILKKYCDYSNPSSVEQLRKKDFERYLSKFNKNVNHKIPDLDIDEWRHARNKNQINIISDYIWDNMNS